MMEIRAVVTREVKTMQEQAQVQRNGKDSYRMHLVTANRLQSEAWAAYNSAFHASESDEYRKAGAELYHRVLEERIRALYLRGDEQNSLIDDHVHS